MLFAFLCFLFLFNNLLIFSRLNVFFNKFRLHNYSFISQYHIFLASTILTQYSFWHYFTTLHVIRAYCLIILVYSRLFNTQLALSFAIMCRYSWRWQIFVSLLYFNIPIVIITLFLIYIVMIGINSWASYLNNFYFIIWIVWLLWIVIKVRFFSLRFKFLEMLFCIFSCFLVFFSSHICCW